jgi:hypothetical protein
MILLHAPKSFFASLVHQKIAVEVGVFKGRFAQQCLKYEPQQLYLIDPYDSSKFGKLTPDDFHGPDPSKEIEDVFSEYYQGGIQNSLEEASKQLKEIIEPHAMKDRVTFVELDSEQASKNFDEGSIDFIHIDANNRYDYVYANLKRWAPKIKPNGIMLIDNCYVSHVGKKQHISSLEAVSTFLKLSDWAPIALSTHHFSNLAICRREFVKEWMQKIHLLCHQNKVFCIELPRSLLHSYHHTGFKFRDSNGQQTEFWVPSFN